jgi:hypothetical protein
MSKQRVKNVAGKERRIGNAYAHWRTEVKSGEMAGEWEWWLLKSWQAVNDRGKNPYARWFMAVMSPFTYGTTDMGDSYLGDVLWSLNSGARGTVTFIEWDTTIWSTQGEFIAWAFNEE